MYVFVDVLINVLCIPLVIKRSSKSQSFCDKLATATVVAKQSLLGLLASLGVVRCHLSLATFKSVAIALHISRHRAAITSAAISISRPSLQSRHLSLAAHASSSLADAHHASRPGVSTLSKSIFVTFKHV